MFFLSSNCHFRAPLSVRCNNNSSDRPGSEYSLPPSYRSRNHNSRPPTIGCDSPNNTIIGNLNELACISSTMTTRTATTESTTPTTHEINQQQIHRTSIISDTFSESIVTTNGIDDDLNNLKISKIIDEKVELDDIRDIVKVSNENLNNKNERDLVTIVTISGCIDNETTNGEIDILANL